MSDIVSNLIAYYSMEPSSIAGGTLANVVDGSANLTLSGSPPNVDGKVGKALSFNGTTQYGSAANGLAAVPGPATFSFWIKPAALSAFAIILDQSVAGGGTVDFRFQLDGSGTHVLFFDNIHFNIVSVATIPLNDWTHVAVTINSSVASIYINGLLDGTWTVANPLSTSATNLFLATYSDLAAKFNGLIDEVRIYTRSLTASDIMAVYTYGLMGGTSKIRRRKRRQRRALRERGMLV